MALSSRLALYMNDSPRHCPLCGQPNDCALANDASGQTRCWCFDIDVDPTALERLPAESRGKACLCPRCAQGKAATSPDDGQDV
ncbi:cysteine-rich CWC family protein [Pseudomonas sp. PIC25]|uniref:cysteine-rich CWC family protein n=1 Tax=Pseudomonas sp. PIC25 TaxID=1958773 RepID=UPI0026C49CB6